MAIAAFKPVLGTLSPVTAGFALAGDNAGFCRAILRKTAGNQTARLESLTYILPDRNAGPEGRGESAPVVVNLLMQLRASCDQNNIYLRTGQASQAQILAQLRQTLSRSDQAVRAQADAIERAVRSSLFQENEFRQALARLEREVKKNGVKPEQPSALTGKAWRNTSPGPGTERRRTYSPAQFTDGPPAWQMPLPRQSAYAADAQTDRAGMPPLYGSTRQVHAQPGQTGWPNALTERRLMPGGRERSAPLETRGTVEAQAAAREKIRRETESVRAAALPEHTASASGYGAPLIAVRPQEREQSAQTYSQGAGMARPLAGVQSQRSSSPRRTTGTYSQEKQPAPPVIHARPQAKQEKEPLPLPTDTHAPAKEQQNPSTGAHAPAEEAPYPLGGTHSPAKKLPRPPKGVYSQEKQAKEPAPTGAHFQLKEQPWQNELPAPPIGVHSPQGEPSEWLTGAYSQAKNPSGRSVHTAEADMKTDGSVPRERGARPVHSDSIAESEQGNSGLSFLIPGNPEQTAEPRIQARTEAVYTGENEKTGTPYVLPDESETGTALKGDRKQSVKREMSSAVIPGTKRSVGYSTGTGLYANRLPASFPAIWAGAFPVALHTGAGWTATNPFFLSFLREAGTNSTRRMEKQKGLPDGTLLQWRQIGVPSGDEVFSEGRPVREKAPPHTLVQSGMLSSPGLTQEPVRPVGRIEQLAHIAHTASSQTVQATGRAADTGAAFGPERRAANERASSRRTPYELRGPFPRAASSNVRSTSFPAIKQEKYSQTARYVSETLKRIPYSEPNVTRGSQMSVSMVGQGLPLIYQNAFPALTTVAGREISLSAEHRVQNGRSGASLRWISDHKTLPTHETGAANSGGGRRSDSAFTGTAALRSMSRMVPRPLRWLELIRSAYPAPDVRKHLNTDAQVMGLPDSGRRFLSFAERQVQSCLRRNPDAKAAPAHKMTGITDLENSERRMAAFAGNAILPETGKGILYALRWLEPVLPFSSMANSARQRFPVVRGIRQPSARRAGRAVLPERGMRNSTHEDSLRRAFQWEAVQFPQSPETPDSTAPRKNKGQQISGFARIKPLSVGSMVPHFRIEPEVFAPSRFMTDSAALFSSGAQTAAQNAFYLNHFVFSGHRLENGSGDGIPRQGHGDRAVWPYPKAAGIRNENQLTANAISLSTENLPRPLFWLEPASAPHPGEETSLFRETGASRRVPVKGGERLIANRTYDAIPAPVSKARITDPARGRDRREPPAMPGAAAQALRRWFHIRPVPLGNIQAGQIPILSGMQRFSLAGGKPPLYERNNSHVGGTASLKKIFRIPDGRAVGENEFVPKGQRALPSIRHPMALSSPRGAWPWENPVVTAAAERIPVRVWLPAQATQKTVWRIQQAGTPVSDAQKALPGTDTMPVAVRGLLRQSGNCWTPNTIKMVQGRMPKPRNGGPETVHTAHGEHPPTGVQQQALPGLSHFAPPMELLEHTLPDVPFSEAVENKAEKSTPTQDSTLMIFRTPAPQTPQAAPSREQTQEGEQEGEAVLAAQSVAPEQARAMGRAFSYAAPAPAESPAAQPESRGPMEYSAQNINYNRLTEEIMVRLERRLRAERRKFGL